MNDEKPIAISLINVRKTKDGEPIIVLPYELLQTLPEPIFPDQPISVFTFEGYLVIAPLVPEGLTQ